MSFAAMLHSLFVPHIVATVPQNWLTWPCSFWHAEVIVGLW